MSAPRILSLVVALILTASVEVLAQGAPPLSPGDRVRVMAPSISKNRLVGTVVELGADTCVLKVERQDNLLALPLASLTRLEVSDQESEAVTGAVVGGVLGGAAGLITTYAICYMECSPEEGRNAGILLGVGGAAVGAGIGALIGSAIKTDRWEEVPLERLRVTVLPQRRGGFAVSLGVKL